MSYALITGASKGIGKAIATELAKRQRNLILVARSEQLLQSVAQEISQAHGVQVHTLALDLSADGAAQSILNYCQQKRYEVDFLVNNAGYGLSGAFESQSVADNTNMVQLNVVALMQLCQTMLPMLKRQPKAYILNIVSTAAYQAVPNLSVYAATKAFVLSFTRGLRYELRNTSVSVTAISPGATDTEFVSRAQISEKGLKAAAKVNMTPQAVAQIAVEATLNQKNEVVTGWLNKLSTFLVWLAPKAITEKAAAGIYE
jgi:uncharacterized protein